MTAKLKPPYLHDKLELMDTWQAIATDQVDDIGAWRGHERKRKAEEKGRKS